MRDPDHPYVRYVSRYNADLVPWVDFPAEATDGRRLGFPALLKEMVMMKMNRSLVILAAGVCITGYLGFAQSAGQATYRAKCQSCHGSTGIPYPGIAKTLGVKPISDPEVQKHSETEMIKVTEEGKGKMPAYKGKLTDEQIKDAVSYFRSLK